MAFGDVIVWLKPQILQSKGVKVGSAVIVGSDEIDGEVVGVFVDGSGVGASDIGATVGSTSASAVGGVGVGREVWADVGFVVGDRVGESVTGRGVAVVAA